ncbi:MAG: geranylgeranyl reductase family protein [Polyangiaceae bacterium]
MTGRYDVLVIGAGPAGAAAAIHAARAGLSVALIDRSRFPRAKTCGDALSNLALRELADLGVREPLEARGTPVHGAVAIFPDGFSVRRSYGALPGCILPRFLLDEAIVRRAVEAGATLLEGHQAEHVLTESDGTLRIVARRRDGAPTSRRLELHGRCVIGADGPGSLARRALGQPHAIERHLGVAATGYFTGVKLGEAHTSEHYFAKSLPHGYFWVFPAASGESNVGVYQRADTFKQNHKKLGHLLDGFVSEHPESFGAAERRGPLHSWQLPLSHWGLPPAGPGILCCGDAASGVDGLTGEGIFQALYSGRLAAESAATALARGGSIDAADAKRYQRRLARRISFPQAGRSLIQEALTQVVDHDLERFGVVQRLLELGYGGGALEITKRVGAA